MFKRASLTGAAFSLLFAAGIAQAQTPVNTRVLVLNQVGGYAHTTAINALATLIQNNAAAWNLTVTVSNSASNFTLPYLRGFDVVMLNNNTTLGNVITGAGQAAFIQWMQEGGGVVGNHGAMDHGNSWHWYTDNMALSMFSGHSGYCDAPNSMVRVDTIPTAGTIRAQKPEYAPLVSALPKGLWNWCDEWYAFTSNPRNLVDMLITIDEKTFVPSNVMGDHPVTWALKMPVGPTGKQGKYFYSSRGHETPAFNDANTKLMFHFGLCWASGRGFSSTSCTTPAVSITDAGKNVIPTTMEAGFLNGALQVGVKGTGMHHVEITTVSGKRVATESVEGDQELSFRNLPGSMVYLVRVKTGNQILNQRIVR